MNAKTRCSDCVDATDNSRPHALSSFPSLQSLCQYTALFGGSSARREAENNLAKTFVGGVFVVFAAVAAYAQGPMMNPQPIVPSTGMHAILLGTGCPLINPERATGSTLIVVNGKTFMVDTGWNSLVRLTQAGYQHPGVVLYTHFHSDHYDGLGQVFINRGIAGADQPLSVISPKGGKAVIDAVIASLAADVGYRKAHHGDKWSDEAVAADVKEFDEGTVYDADDLKIIMFPVDHHPIEPAVGYRFEYGGKSIVISGDTVKCDRLIAESKGCDILIHEAMDDRMLKAILPGLTKTDPRRGAMLTELIDYHTPTLQVAEIARDAGVKKLVLTHLVPSIAPIDAAEKNFIRGMAEIYPGPIAIGRDLMTFTP